MFNLILGCCLKQLKLTTLTEFSRKSTLYILSFFNFPEVFLLNSFRDYWFLRNNTDFI